LVHEHREKVQEEREEQRRIKEQMREEEKAQKEIEKAQQAAEKDEAVKEKALKKAQQQLADATEQQTDRLQTIVDKLEKELKEALERKAKAIARAQLTRSGHVYVLSNVGSFGEGVYKIGMTRRLEPLDRVKELGDASVPFKYDVHAMMYSEDAPALEAALHRHFSERRLNLVNLRREFFQVSLDDIRSAVSTHFGEITFVTVPKAEEFRRTQAARSAGETNSTDAVLSPVAI
jgi:seryl-tRNA synthetase